MTRRRSATLPATYTSNAGCHWLRCYHAATRFYAGTGTGTTLAALAAGLPVVLVPQGADQFDNAHACQHAGAARVIMPDRVTAPAVRHAIAAVLDTLTPRDDAGPVGACRSNVVEPNGK